MKKKKIRMRGREKLLLIACQSLHQYLHFFQMYTERSIVLLHANSSDRYLGMNKLTAC